MAPPCLTDADDDAACGQADGRDRRSELTASNADDAAWESRDCDDDEASYVCDCVRGPSYDDVDPVYYTHCSINCCETPARCHPGPGRLPTVICYFFDVTPNHRTICLYLKSN